MSDDATRDRLRRLSSDRLADELLSLGSLDASVRDRVDRLSVEHDPKALAKALTRSINGLGQTGDFVSYGRSFDVAHDLQHIVDTTRDRLLPRDPDLAFGVADQFLESDAQVFGWVDDSAGAVGDVFRDACRLWLETATKSTVKRDWVALFKERISKDDYGARGELLPKAAILFSEADLREMAAGYLAEAKKPGSANDRLNYEALSAASNARQLAIALRDPRLFEEATKSVGGGLNNLQRIEVVRKYLEFGDAATALAHLQEVPETPSSERLDLLAECYGRLGRIPEQIKVLETIFEQTLWKGAYEQILDLEADGGREARREWGRKNALEFKHVVSAAAFLFAVGWPDDAEQLVLERADELATKAYTQLLELAELAENAGKRTVEVICYRHLIRDVLGEARSRAYGHAVRYLRKLADLALVGVDYGKLGDHTLFLAELRQQHGRKSAFWRRVEGKS